MEPVQVPAVPREAFNKHRRISDLVRKQVEHFRHIEEKLPSEARAKLPQHDIVTEDDAARYIHAVTGYLVTRPVEKKPKAAKQIAAVKHPAPIRATPPLALAAAAAPARKQAPAKKQSAAKKETPAAKRSPSIKSKDKKTSTKRKK
jgi:hypothetical protein